MTKYLDHTIASNKRSDNMYHSYNLMTVESDQEVSIAYLSEMLEGQVAALSSGYLSPDESLLLLDGLKASKLFRDDQYSYILYPNKDLAGFTEKNTIPKSSIEKSDLLTRLLKDENRDIVIQDVKGGYHFNGNFKNAKDLENALLNLSETDYSPLVKSDQKLLLKTFEEVFNHKAFTGRSGTFYGYEGLGSIYWHMVSKLLLAVQECCLKAIDAEASDEIIGRLLEHYYEINEGIGVHKSPKLYGAFPTDPYSHTPFGKGAQQPGMTGQVKEDVIARFGELGVFTQDGKLQFNPCMLKKDEFLKSKELFNYKDIDSNDKQIEIESGSLAFTYCQVPIVYTISDTNSLEVVFSDGKTHMIDTLSLDKDLSKHLFERSGKIAQIKAQISGTILK